MLSWIRSGLKFGHHLKEALFYPVPHRQYIFSVPTMLRRFFFYDHKLLGNLSQCAVKISNEILSAHPGQENRSGMPLFYKKRHAQGTEHAAITMGACLLLSSVLDAVLFFKVNMMQDFLNSQNSVTIQVGAPNWHNHQVVTVQECSILVHLGLRSILVLFEKAQMGQDGVLLNSYQNSFIG